MRILLVTILSILAGAAYAKGFNKCIVDGQVVYSQRNCPTHESRAVFGGGTFSSLHDNKRAGKNNYEAFQKRAYKVAKRQNYRESSDGKINEHLVNKVEHKEVVVHDENVNKLNVREKIKTQLTDADTKVADEKNAPEQAIEKRQDKIEMVKQEVEVPAVAEQ